MWSLYGLYVVGIWSACDRYVVRTWSVCSGYVFGTDIKQAVCHAVVDRIIITNTQVENFF